MRKHTQQKKSQLLTKQCRHEGREENKKSTNKMDKQIKMFTKTLQSYLWLVFRESGLKGKIKLYLLILHAFTNLPRPVCLPRLSVMANMLLLHCLYLLCCAMYCLLPFYAFIIECVCSYNHERAPAQTHASKTLSSTFNIPLSAYFMCINTVTVHRITLYYE